MTWVQRGTGRFWSEEELAARERAVGIEPLIETPPRPSPGVGDIARATPRPIVDTKGRPLRPEPDALCWIDWRGREHPVKPRRSELEIELEALHARLSEQQLVSEMTRAQFEALHRGFDRHEARRISERAFLTALLVMFGLVIVLVATLSLGLR